MKPGRFTLTALLAILIGVTHTNIALGMPTDEQHLASRDADAEHNKALFIRSIKHGDTEKIKNHIYSGFKINAYLEDGKTPLIIAIESIKIDAVKFLIEMGADPNKPSAGTEESPRRSPVWYSIRSGDTYIFEYMLKVAKPKNILHTIAKHGNNHILLEYVKSLEYGLTQRAIEDAIEIAISRDDKDITIVMIAYMYDINGQIENFYNKQDVLSRSLLLSSASGNLEISKLLVEQGASLSRRDSQGRTPLMIAANGGHMHLVEYFKQIAGKEKTPKEKH